jgi:hypothetical protein
MKIIRQIKLISSLLLSLSLLVSPIPYAQDNDSRVVSRPEKYNIAPDRSILKIYIGRAGLLSELGHNHVVVNKAITGELEYIAAPGVSSATFIIPVHKLVVDDDNERQLAGIGYESVPSESDIQGTWKNMLGPGVLDGDKYPEIKVHVNGITSLTSLNRYDIRVDFKGNQIDLNLNGQTQKTGDMIRIDAFFILSHDQLNLKPYSVLGGMLKVAEQLRFELHIEALPE